MIEGLCLNVSVRIFDCWTCLFFFFFLQTIVKRLLITFIDKSGDIRFQLVKLYLSGTLGARAVCKRGGTWLCKVLSYAVC